MHEARLKTHTRIRKTHDEKYREKDNEMKMSYRGDKRHWKSQCVQKHNKQQTEMTTTVCTGWFESTNARSISSIHIKSKDGL